jgi:HAMP domain-containing protein
MIVNCDKCGMKYKVDETKIIGESARFKCNSCGNIVVVTSAEKVEVDEVESAPGADAGRRTGPQPPDEKRFKVKWRDSIQVRMGAIMVILTAVIFAAYIMVTYMRTKDRMDTELNQLATIVVTRLSQSLVGPLWDLDDNQMSNTIASEMMERRIFAILIKDTDGKSILKGWKRDNNWNLIEAKTSVPGNFVKSSKKIVKGDELIGTVETYLTSRFMEEDFNRSVFDITITALVLIVAILLTFILTFRALLVRPIMQLADAAAQMSVGDLNVEINVKSKNEIGLLVGAIERMQESLRLAMDRLRRRDT